MAQQLGGRRLFSFFLNPFRSLLIRLARFREHALADALLGLQGWSLRPARLVAKGDGV